MRKNTITIVAIVATLVLAGIAIFSATRLFNVGQDETSPTTPTGSEAAPGPNDTVVSCQAVSFTIAQATTSPSPSGSPTTSPTTSPTASPTLPPLGGSTPTPSPTATPTAGPTSAPTNPPGSTSTPIPGAPASSATPAPELPAAGIATPTTLAIGIAVIFLLGALLLAI